MQIETLLDIMDFQEGFAARDFHGLLGMAPRDAKRSNKITELGRHWSHLYVAEDEQNEDPAATIMLDRPLPGDLSVLGPFHSPGQFVQN